MVAPKITGRHQAWLKSIPNPPATRTDTRKATGGGGVMVGEICTVGLEAEAWVAMALAGVTQ
jgi:hypothetical protein